MANDVSGSRRCLRTALLVAAMACVTVAAHPAAADGLSASNNYLLRCTGCHRMDGTGNPQGGIPDFRDSVGYFSAFSKGREYLVHVPGVLESSLTPKEIADVLNYVITRWGGKSLPDPYHPFTESEVAERQKVRIDDVVEFRRGLVLQLNEQGISVADYPWP